MGRSMNRQRIAQVHVAKAKLGMSEDDYRELLHDYAGVDSSKELDDTGFECVMLRFHELGFESDWLKRHFGYRAGMATPRQVALIRKLWEKFTDGRGDDAQLGRWLDGTFKVSSPRFLTREYAGKAIAALSKMAERRDNSGRAA